MCVWQGFIASAPGHPILAHAIETVVNQVRNKFTSVDIDERYCPNPNIAFLHRWDLIFATGPCLLGASMNKALGRPGQMQFEPGEVLVSTVQPPVPGRTLILDTNRSKVNGIRFFLVEKKMVMAATDLPVGRDKKQNKKPSYYGMHQYGIQDKQVIFGEKGVYANDHKANEDIRIIVPQ
jgi:hypothetical protein